MKKIIESYDINSKTLALLPAKNIDYDTIVLKLDGTKYVRETALNLIKAACYDDWCSYDGKRQAVIRHTNFTRKVPIPISICKGIYLFPTHSPYNLDNNWIAYQHILKIEKVPKHLATKEKQSMIHFKNGETLIVNVSIHTLKAQYQRTFECMFRIEGIESLKKNYPW